MHDQVSRNKAVNACTNVNQANMWSGLIYIYDFTYMKMSYTITLLATEWKH